MAELGCMPVFMGVETSDWGQGDFETAGGLLKEMGATSALFKCADGGNKWYGGNFKQIADFIENGSGGEVEAIPYTYCYGNKFNAINTETAILIQLLDQFGIVVADMEVEFNGHPEYARTFSAALKPVSGSFGVCSWGDPSLQNWNAVLFNLAPCVNFWMPQVYSNFLAGIYKADYSKYGLPIYPVVSLGNWAGPNDPVAIAHNSNSPVVGIWHYADAISSGKQLVQQIREGLDMGVPTGWTDDPVNGILYSPDKKFPIQHGFRDFILNNRWDANNWAIGPEQGRSVLEISDPALGSGTRQLFRLGMLEWTPKRGVFSGWIGNELQAVEAKVGVLHSLLTSVSDGYERLRTMFQNALRDAA